jgi:hypothetical protein
MNLPASNEGRAYRKYRILKPITIKNISAAPSLTTSTDFDHDFGWSKNQNKKKTKNNNTKDSIAFCF